MKICAGCPQYKRVCDGEPKSEKKYCLYYHATNHSPKYIQSDKVESIFAEVMKEIKDISPWYESNDYSIEIYKGYKLSYELIFYTDGNTDKKQAIKKALRFLNEKYSISQ